MRGKSIQSGAVRVNWKRGAAVAALALGMAGGAFAQPVAEDAGDSIATGARLAVGETVRASISPAADADWYRVSVRPGQLYEFRLAGDGDSPLSDPYLVLYDAEGTEISSNDDYNGELNSRIAFVPSARANVFIAARGLSEDLTGGYTLSAAASALPADDAGNDTRTRARLATGSSFDGALNYVGDRDVFRVALEGGQSYRFTLRTTGEGEGALADPMLRLLDASGEEIAQDDDSGGGLNSYIEFSPEASGDFFVEARGFGDDAEGAYRVSAAVGDIPADTSTDAELSADGDYRAGNLSPAGDSDWYRVTLSEGQAMRVSLDGAEGGLGDPLLVIHGPDGGELARNDDAGGSLNSRLEFAATAAGDYFVEARGFGDDAEGAYTVNLTAGEVGASAETAEYLTPNEGGQSSVLGANGDHDWFALDVIEARPYRFNLTADEGSEVDLVLSLRDAEGNVVAADDDGGSGPNAYLTFVSPEGGTFYADVGAFNDEGAGAYTLRVSDTDVPGHPGTDETLMAENEGGDDRLSVIDMAGDKDIYRADLTAGVSYTIEVRGAGDRPLADPFLTILSSDGSGVSTDDDSGPGADSRLVFRPTATDSYFIQATGLGGAVGGYTVSVRRNP